MPASSCLALWRHWPGLATAALLGTQGLFWLWHVQNYHPEKLAWAVGFQLVIYLLFVLHSLTAHVFRRRTASWEDLARLMLNACLWFTAAYILLRPDYRDWLGLLAVGMAMVYVVLGRVMLGRRPEDGRQLLTALAAAVGFIALAFPIQARAEWIALGWAAESAALWWFGLRTRSPALRGMAAAVAVLAVGRLVFVDTPHRGLESGHADFQPVRHPGAGRHRLLAGLGDRGTPVLGEAGTGRAGSDGAGGRPGRVAVVVRLVRRYLRRISMPWPTRSWPAKKRCGCDGWARWHYRRCGPSMRWAFSPSDSCGGCPPCGGRPCSSLP